jgi:plasmid stabilization system protein ParE
VAGFRFSRRAEADLLEIARYTLHRWGEAQVIRYLDDLEACCRKLAENPTLQL